MRAKVYLVLIALLLAVSSLVQGIGPGLAADPLDKAPTARHRAPTPAERKAAAARFKKLYEAALVARDKTGPRARAQAEDAPQAGAATAAAAMDPGGVPHYFGPYPNYANSPMPKGAVASITLDNGGTGYTAPLVTIVDVYDTGSGASASASVDPATGAISGITLTNGGSGYSAPVVVIADPTGTDAAATAIIGGPLTGGIRKFVDSLPGLGAANKNNLGQYLPVAIPDTTTFPPGGRGYTSWSSRIPPVSAPLP